MDCSFSVAALCGAPFVANADVETASATAAATFAADTRGGTIRAMSPCSVEYSPSWGGVADEGAYVVIEKVEHAGMFNAITSTVTTCAADAEAAFSYSTGDGEPCVRFIHRVYSSGGTEIGTPLVRDVSFGVSSSPGVAVFADCRTNSLQEAVSAGGTVNLAYSTDWATDAASVTISAVRLSAKDGDDLSTNTFFSAAASAEGVTAMRGGWTRLVGGGFSLGSSALMEPRRSITPARSLN